MKLLCLCLLWTAVPLVQAAEVNFQPTELTPVDGVLNLTLTVALERSLNGTRLSALYNGGPIGPTLRVKPGDTIHVTLVNNLPAGPEIDRELMAYCHDPANAETPEGYVNVTIVYNRLSAIGNIYDPEYGYWGTSFQNIHWHGAGFPPVVEDLMHPIDGGGNVKHFNYTIPLDHPPGLTWYHSHVHGVAAHGVMSGTFGIMVIEGTQNDVTAIPEIGAAREIFMMMSEALYNNDTGLVDPFLPIVMSFNWSSVVNGILAEDNVYEVEQNETILFRAISASVEPTIRLYWKNASGPDLWVVSEDGFPVRDFQAAQDNSIIVPAGSRVEFMALFDTPGTYELRRLPWNLGITGVNMCNATFGIPLERCLSYDRDMLIATIVVLPTNQTAEPFPTEVPELFPTYDNWQKKEIVGKRTISLDQAMGYPIFQVPYDGPFVPPGTGFGMDRILVTPHFRHGNVTAGTCEEWTITSNPPGAEHAFHSHTVPFIVTHEDGIPVDEPYWRDTHAVMGANSTIKICFWPSRFVEDDYVLIHCHAAAHMDIGMAAYFYVWGEGYVPPGSAPNPPSISPPTAAPKEEDTTSSARILQFVVTTLVLVFTTAYLF